ncbi:MAG: hypothetical protein VZR09_07795 [Candidatus Gastranaerophilaceae bacterium]|jgi:hypothetical protein|nr:hypothetical protein [Candidatus Gastranaerophilaceae bacterium]
MVDRKEIPFCPLMSAGSEVDMVCTQDRCGWYVPSVKKCSIYILGFNALLEANTKQTMPKQRI